MAVSIEDIKKLRHMTGAGMMDCKNALAETDGDIQAAIEIIRKKGQAVAAKREDRNASQPSSPSSSRPTSLPKTSRSAPSQRRSSTPLSTPA